jgi:hypothetical protein
MWQPLEVLLRQFDRWRCRRNVRRALALCLRGEARRDGLVLVRARHWLEVRWRSRNIHPWESEVSLEREAQLFREQLAADTEAAILRLFQALPQIDRIDLQVLEPASDTVILSGTVHRSALSAVQSVMSVRMRLMSLGVSFLPLDCLR